MIMSGYDFLKSQVLSRTGRRLLPLVFDSPVGGEAVRFEQRPLVTKTSPTRPYTYASNMSMVNFTNIIVPVCIVGIAHWLSIGHVPYDVK